MARLVPEPTIAQHFAGRTPSVRETYERIVRTVPRLGEVRQEPKKTPIHLSRRTAFAGIVTRRDALILTIKSTVDIDSPRVIKHEQLSAHRWHLQVRLNDPAQVDRELMSWLQRAADL